VGVRKFRSVEEMPGPPVRTPLDPENLRIAFGLVELGTRLSPLRRPPGLRKFASWDEAMQARDQAILSALRARK